MKKSLLLLSLFFLFLTGCTPVQVDILAQPEGVDVCQEECITENEEVLALIDDYHDQLDQLALELVPEYDDELFQLQSDIIYSRDDIPQQDLVTSNSYIPLDEPYFRFGRALYEAERLVNTCELGVECIEQNIDVRYQVLDFDYGFDEDGGYANFRMGNTIETAFIRDIKFRFEKDGLSFEYLDYDFLNDNYIYGIMSEGIYREYMYDDSEHFYFTYINMNTEDYLYYYTQEYGELIVIYDQNTEMNYTMGLNGDFTVAKMQDHEYLASLRSSELGYTLRFNLFKTEGWNKVSWGVEDLSPYASLYLDDESVLTDYEAEFSPINSHFYALYAEITNSDVNQLQFPTGFTGDVTLTQLNEELTNFIALEDPCIMFGLSKETIVAKIMEVKSQFDTDLNMYS